MRDRDTFLIRVKVMVKKLKLGLELEFVEIHRIE